MGKEELKKFDESYQWWGEFLEVRKEALHAMKRMGMSYEAMYNTLNFNWVGQPEVILYDSISKYEDE